jgi:hypothetical protein
VPSRDQHRTVKRRRWISLGSGRFAIPHPGRTQPNLDSTQSGEATRRTRFGGTRTWSPTRRPRPPILEMLGCCRTAAARPRRKGVQHHHLWAPTPPPSRTRWPSRQREPVLPTSERPMRVPVTDPAAPPRRQVRVGHQSSVNVRPVGRMAVPRRYRTARPVPVPHRECPRRARSRPLRGQPHTVPAPRSVGSRRSLVPASTAGRSRID